MSSYTDILDNVLTIICVAVCSVTMSYFGRLKDLHGMLIILFLFLMVWNWSIAKSKLNMFRKKYNKQEAY